MKNESTILIIVLIAAIVLIFGGVGMGYEGYGGMMNMMYGSYGSGMMYFGWIYSFLILVALVLLVAWLVKEIQK